LDGTSGGVGEGGKERRGGIGGEGEEGRGEEEREKGGREREIAL